ncbi:insulin-like growth factor-binding protein complex acid labile subunit [Copidosoma floridanum]|uniref:insulin-like growth factor-binding protein complex acid labile subunit n=1 Tax=Copidosoma floridanum TaxID=29053 RepID=UPI0006C9873E|nr:insulin-like growth factor-binding protein complex acid labile subunit [Copidosoma floridanum]
MYRRAQIWLRYSLPWLALLASLPRPLDAAVAALGSPIATDATKAASSTPDWCIQRCMCLSKTQILCNTGGFTDIPSKLPHNVEELTLSKNDFHEIRKNMFAHLRSLHKLELDYNNISAIKPFAFNGLSKLKVLSIQHTPLAHIGEFSFAALQNVTTILLAHNRIAYIAGKAFAGSSQIQFIMLTHNPLVVIQSNAFSGLTYVENLVLPGGIADIEPDAFNGFEYVGLLKMPYMDLKDGLKANTFRGLKHVLKIMIQTSDLRIIRKDSFVGLDQVGSLNIISSKIDAIEEFHLNANYSVSILRFQKNHVLRAPRPDDVAFHVSNLYVEGNHFPCDCQIHLVLDSDFVNGSANEFRRRNYCISNAPEFNGRPMSSVDLDSIASCHDRLTKDNYGSGVSVGSGALSLLSLGFVYASRLLVLA